VNKQISYITSAHLILISIAAGYFFLSKISSASNHQDQDAYYSVRNEKTPVLSEKAAKGKTLFMSKCAVCHHLFKIVQGPALAGVLERGPWADRKQLYEWIRNPEGFMKKSAYTQELKKIYTIPMQPFPSITDEEIDLILAYIEEAGTSAAMP
jgi:cytochrome c2